MLELKNASKLYKMGDDVIHALDNFTYSFQDRNMYALSGPSGSGKTTLLSIIGGMIPLTSGEVYLNGKNIEAFKENELASYRFKEIGFIFQSFDLISVLNVFDNIMLGCITGKKSMQMSKKEIVKETNEIIEKLGLGRWKKHKPSELSGGQIQRVAIARALVKKPSVILADEPTAALDTANAISVIKLLTELNSEYGTVCIVATHDNRVVDMIPNRIRLEDGRLV